MINVSKEWTEEERKAHSEKMKAAHAARKSTQDKNNETKPAEQSVTLTQYQFNQLMQRINQLEQQPKPEPAQALNQVVQMQQPTVTNQGIQGIQYKYPVDKGYYKDPTDRLYQEPELKRFALGENFIFTWSVEGIVYEKYNITYSEPKFTVELYRKMFDEEGNETGKLAFVNRNILHEDELTARIIADKMGLLTPETNLADLLDEMRYMRIRQWLLDLFKPKQIKAVKNNLTTTVIDGKVVEIIDQEDLVTPEQADSLRL